MNVVANSLPFVLICETNLAEQFGIGTQPLGNRSLTRLVRQVFIWQES
jgi:hypothetical protein